MGEILNKLIELGYADEAGVAAEVVSRGETQYLCVNGDVITLATAALEKIFSDSIDKIERLSIKGGLFGKSIRFTHSGTEYALKVKGGKNVVEYFKLLAE